MEKRARPEKQSAEIIIIMQVTRLPFCLIFALASAHLLSVCVCVCVLQSIASFLSPRF